MRFLTLLIAAFFAIIGTVHARTFTDSAGRKVELPDTVNSVLAAGPPASVLIYTVAPEKLAGWVREPGAKDKEYLLKAVADLPTYGRLTGKGGTANIEAALAAKPDFILDVGTISDTYISLADKVQEQTGIPYILIDGSFDKTADVFKLMGELLGTEERAQQLADYATKTIDGLNTKLGAIAPENRPAVYYGRGGDGLETGMDGSINLEILNFVGGKNVAAVTGKGGLTNVSLEQVLTWNPQIILGSDEKFVAAVKTDPLWKEVNAVQNGLVFRTPMRPFGWFDTPPSVNRLIGVRWLEQILYPDSFEGDLRAETRDFYKLFYQVDLSDAQVDALLHDAVRAQ
ncbi:iron complex transport system substrate-binding protein [Paenochrobactrum gallinarii]|uniref:Iron complex transport system substrate-binding protein n=1 Tax=Paenochrobactrum gallinarii TaxID=643673 RepID=A0A841M737_9HYPH|nr:iron ABC transporter substrate-binding protein [Paenochrobactrum gallinarii]MBB6262071.1 iron complex transport system substrate-binding protein [Paenochrobactrum gallinarii]